LGPAPDRVRRELAIAAFNAWYRSGFERRALSFFQGPEAETLLWPHVPIPVLLAVLAAGISDFDVPWATLADDQCGAVLNAEWGHLPASALGLLDVITPDWIPLAVNWYRSDGPQSAWLRLWHRHTTRVASACFDALAHANEHAAGMLHCVPATRTVQVIDAFEKWRRTTKPSDHLQRAFISWLHRCAVNRAAGWDAAYTTLNELSGFREQRVSEVQR
jgi:hypothetical protein